MAAVGCSLHTGAVFTLALGGFLDATLLANEKTRIWLEALASYSARQVPAWPDLKPNKQPSTAAVTRLARIP